MKAIIVGGGKVGYYLAKTLHEKHYDITLIEADREQCRYCANNLQASVVFGDGTTAEALSEAGAQKADVLIAAMGSDEGNLVSCQLAKKHFGVKKTIARVNNPKNRDTFEKLGIDIAVSATDSIIRELEHKGDFSTTKVLLDLDDDNESSIIEITFPENYALEGRCIRDIDLPAGCNIACIHRGGRMIIPRGQTMLISGDEVLVVTLNSEIKGLKKALKIKD